MAVVAAKSAPAHMQLGQSRPTYVARTACADTAVHVVCVLHAALYALWPPAGPAGSKAAIYGNSNWMLDQDCATTQLTEGAPPCFGSIMVGGYTCSPDVNSYSKGNPSRFSGAWLYKLTCSLPAPGQVSTCSATVAATAGGRAQHTRHSAAHTCGCSGCAAIQSRLACACSS